MQYTDASLKYLRLEFFTACYLCAVLPLYPNFA